MLKKQGETRNQSPFFVVIAGTTVKLPLYAKHGIRECWLVNLRESEIEVYQKPEQGSFSEKQVCSHGQSITAATMPHCQLEIAKLFA